MGTAATPTRENRTITVDFRDEATYFRLIGDGKAFILQHHGLVYSWIGYQTSSAFPRIGHSCTPHHPSQKYA
jgi:hypothetical protein